MSSFRILQITARLTAQIPLKRLICIYDTSRTYICGKKCISIALLLSR